jgi:hypothetical protein
MGAVYLGGGQTLAAMTPRLLTKNAHVARFLCAPTGTRVGYISDTDTPEEDPQTVDVATIATGDTTTYYSCDIPAGKGQNGNSSAINDLDGWSDDAAYLAFDVIQTNDAPSNSSIMDQLECIDLVHGSVFPVPLPLDQMPPAPSDQTPPAQNRPNDIFGQYKRVAIVFGAAWAPGKHLFAFGLRAKLNEGGKVSLLCLFDPNLRSTRVLYTEGPLSKRLLICEGWLDARHIAYGQGQNQFVYDLDAGKLSAAAPGPPKNLAHSFGDSPEVAELMPNKANLTLSETPPKSEDQYDYTVHATSLWITRTGGAPKPSKLLLDTFLASYDINDDPGIKPQFAPSGGFDRQGVYHVVYPSEGDLKVVDLIQRPATSAEKLAYGEKFNCEQEIPLAESDARRIGLGILQWVQDNNDAWPAADGFHDEIKTYITNYAIFTAPNGAPFHYTPPKEPKADDVKDPANTPLGEFDLPCAKIVLYADGHVVAEQSVPAGQSGSSP